MNWNDEATRLAALTPPTTTAVEAFAHFGRVVLRGRCCPSVQKELLIILCENLFDEDAAPAIGTSGDKWACLTSIEDDADGYEIYLVDAATQALVGTDTSEMGPAYFELIRDDKYQAAVWGALIAGEATPDMVKMLARVS